LYNTYLCEDRGISLFNAINSLLRNVAPGVSCLAEDIKGGKNMLNCFWIISGYKSKHKKSFKSFEFIGTKAEKISLENYLKNTL
jgi:hypothetical protein